MWNIERQLARPAEGKLAALTAVCFRERDEPFHLARGPNLDFHARSIRRGGSWPIGLGEQLG